MSSLSAENSGQVLEQRLGGRFATVENEIGAVTQSKCFVLDRVADRLLERRWFDEIVGMALETFADYVSRRRKVDVHDSWEIFLNCFNLTLCACRIDDDWRGTR